MKKLLRVAFMFALLAAGSLNAANMPAAALPAMEYPAQYWDTKLASNPKWQDKRAEWHRCGRELWQMLDLLIAKSRGNAGVDTEIAKLKEGWSHMKDSTSWIDDATSAKLKYDQYVLQNPDPIIARQAAIEEVLKGMLS